VKNKFKPQQVIVKMSSPIANVVLPVESVAPVKAPRKPTLPAKLQKFMMFGFAFVAKLQALDLLTTEAVDSALDELKLMAPLDEQIAYFGDYLAKESVKASNKAMRSWITQKKKPLKAPKAPKAPKEKKVKEPKLNADGTVKEKKPRAKKAVVVATNSGDDLIANLVDAAQSTTPAQEEKKSKKVKKDPKAAALVQETTPLVVDTPVGLTEETAPVVADTKLKKVKAEKPVKEAKVKAEKETKPEKPVKAEKETKPVKAPKEKVEKPKKETKAKKDTVVDPIPEPIAQPETLPETEADDDDDDDDDAIHAREFIFNGTTYLIDTNSNLIYDLHSQDLLGKYDPSSLTIAFDQ